MTHIMSFISLASFEMLSALFTLVYVALLTWQGFKKPHFEEHIYRFQKRSLANQVISKMRGSQPWPLLR